MKHKEPLRILHVIPAYKPANRFGGAVESVSAIAEKLATRGHSVTVFTTDCDLDQTLDVPISQPVVIEGVNVWYFQRREFIKNLFPSIKYLSQSVGFFFTPALSYALNEYIHQFDLIHSHMVFVYTTLVAGRVAIKAQKPFFFHQHGGFNLEHLKYRGFKKRLYIAAFERPVLQKATTLIALTEVEQTSYRSIGVVTPSYVVPNGIDINKYFQKPVHECLPSFPILPEHMVILFLGRIHFFKGIDLLLEAFCNIASHFPNAILVIAGPDESNLIPQFKQQIKAIGLSERVHFPGTVTGNVKHNLLARADLLCLPSIEEGFSMVLLEACASATPVMITPGCHFPRIEQYGAGKIVVRDVDQWAKTLAELIGSPELLRNMGQNAFHLVEKFYTWDNVIAQLEDVYYEGITRHQQQLST